MTLLLMTPMNAYLTVQQNDKSQALSGSSLSSLTTTATPIILKLNVRQGKRKTSMFVKCAFTFALSLCNKPFKRMMWAASSNCHHFEVMVRLW
jgi:hypothetical protein